jgi:hypothetical protein
MMGQPKRHAILRSDEETLTPPPQPSLPLYIVRPPVVDPEHTRTLAAAAR